MNKYGLFGKFKAKEGQLDALLDILLQASEEMLRVEECEMYVVGKNKEEVNSICVFEVWESKEAHDKSLSDPKAQEIIQKAIPMLEGMPEKGVEIDVAGE